MAAPLRLADIAEPELPGPGWKRITPLLSGICGSDLSTLSGHTSRYFEPLVSFPSVMGHEVVGLTENGNRVVIDAVLGHEARGERPPFEGAAPGDGCDHGHLIGGRIEAGLQIGSCESTSGGWSTSMVADESQLHLVPDTMSEETADDDRTDGGSDSRRVKANVQDGQTVVVLGAGTIGLCLIAVLQAHTKAGKIVATAKYSEQRRLATDLGAHVVVEPAEVRRAVRRITGSRMVGSVLSGGADVVIDAVGSSASLEDALAITRPRGRIVVCGMPGVVQIDLAPSVAPRDRNGRGLYLRHRRTGRRNSRHMFALATELAETADLDRLVTATYPLAHYKQAIRHAAEAGRRGAVKIAFDFRR